MSIITNILDRKQGGPCQICNESHDIKTRCRFEAMARKIVRLTEANSYIPSILAANKEATTLAQHFQSLLKKADQAHTILMEILSLPEYPDGELIKARYLGELDKWAKESISQDTQEQLELLAPENSTPPETPTTNCTSQGNGSDFPKNS